ncbi:uncharacterized protein [Nicotiana sylvestris]|uniref:uncharacterized protein n=1 Tax=Nicotiana sylvestris TaxID=4096 RepID=UPI00388CBBA5
MPTRKLSKWQMLLSEFDIVYVTQKAVKGQSLADHLAENPVGGEYEPLKTYFPDEEVSFMGEDISEAYDSWRMFFDGAANFKGVGIGSVLVSEIGQHYPVSVKLRYKENGPPRIPRYCYICTMYGNRERDKNFIDPIPVRIHNQPAYCAHVEEETDGRPWFHGIIEYLAKGEYPEHANHTQKYTFQRLSNHFFHSRGNLYRRTPGLGLLRSVDVKEASKLLEEIHAGTCGPHMNGFVLAKKILRDDYFLMTMETDYVQFILVAIDYFTKWVEATSYKAVTKKVVADFVLDWIVYRFGVPE